MAVPQVSILIVNFNGRQHLEYCLPALRKTRDISFETIVVDNGSRDGSVPWLRASFPEIRVVEMGRNRGFGAANHAGISEARGEYLAFLNNDTEVDPGWLAPLVHPLANDPTLGAACATLVLRSQPHLLNARGGGMSRLGIGYDRDLHMPVSGLTDAPCELEVFFPTAAAMVMRKNDFLDCGGFDPAMFMYHEDVDLGWRIWLRGQRVVTFTDSVVKHECGATSLEVASRKWQGHMGAKHNVRALLRNYEAPTLRAVLRDLVSHHLRKREFGLLLEIAAWNAVHAFSTWRERIKIQSTRAVSDAELFRRGLIDAANEPPAACAPTRISAQPLFLSHALRPGSPNAETRLGGGWFRPERLDGKLMRWTGAAAKAVLQTEPFACGTLTIRWQGAPFPLPPRVVTISCNEKQAQGTAEHRWQDFSMLVQADGRGLLQVKFEVAVWRPSDLDGCADFRGLGCRVEEIRFEPAVASAPYQPRSASVIIPTFQRAEILGATLAALGRQTCRDFEVIVVDDGSADGSWEKLQTRKTESGGAFPLQILRQEKAGPGAARNRAIERATGEVLIFLGDDMRPAENFIAEHLRRHGELTEPGAVVGYIEWDEEKMRVTPFLQYVNEGGPQYGFRYLQDGEETPYTCFYSSNLSISASLLEARSFDETFTTAAWEDIDFGFRYEQRGGLLTYHAAARVRHWHPYTLKKFLERQAHVGLASHTFFLLHPQLRKPEHRSRRQGEGGFYSWLASHLPPALWERMDERGIPLPEKLYEALLWAAFRRGAQAHFEGDPTRARSSSAVPAPPEIL